MMNKLRIIVLIFVCVAVHNLYASVIIGASSDTTCLIADEVSDLIQKSDTLPEWDMELEEVEVVQRQNGVKKLKSLATNTDFVSKAELLRAACCNLGESFVTNASVDVNYSDAATGAKQIKLLGLSGTYVQMLTENIPNLRGAASLYGLGYIPGTWMQSIQVSKGASSVKNGYESITGQINVEFLKPQTDQSFTGNGYVDIFGKAELNAVGNVHLNNRWSTGLLLHAENGFVSHDGNSDGFIDLPRIKQFAGMNRWAYISDKYIFQAGVNFLAENRLSGQDTHHSENHLGHEPFKISIDTRRWEFFTKNAYIIDAENENNLALILSGSFHSENSKFGAKLCDIAQDNVYASLIYERNWNDGLHALSAGLSMNYDRYDIGMLKVPNCFIEKETTPGAYVQYTFNLNSSLILMGGFRYDHSSQYGSMFTPRVHARWNLFNGALSLYGSVGRGYRSPHVYADTRFYMASSRAHIVMDNITQEIAMNYGGGLSGMVSLFNRPFNYNAEFYYTRFNHQMLTDVDTNPHAVIIKDSENKHNFSRAFQVDVSYPIISELTFTMAYRFTDVKADYGYGLVSKPLMSKNKGLFSVSWAPMMGKWQIDATLAVNGKGRMPIPYQLEDGSMSWNTTYKTFPQLSAQITREFRNWSIYIGGENLTGYRQPTPIIDASNPWGSNFDATMVYGPVHGAMIYAGFQYNFTKY